MTDFVQIHWTAGSIEAARKMARHLVQERLVASAQIIPWVESVYMLNNQLETTQETKILFITHTSLVDSVKNTILKNSQYQIPEILLFPIEEANQEYLDWLQESAKPSNIPS